jgi:hypothetical protein
VFIFWGEYERVRKQGVVADRCKGCSQITQLRVSRIYRVSHVYFIPLGSGKLHSTVAECTECGHKVPFRNEKYSRLVPENEADSLTVDEVLKKTNPPLARSTAELQQLEREAIGARPGASAGPDPRVKLAFSKLAEIETESAKVIDLQARLAQWSALRLRDQEVLLSDIDALFAEHQQRDSVKRFVSAMGQRFKPEVDGTVSFLTFLGLLILGIALAVMMPVPELRVSGVLLAFVLAAGIATVVHGKYKRYIFKRFFRQTFLPQTQKRQIDLGDALAELEELDPNDETLSDGLRAMVKRRRFLQEVLDEEGISVQSKNR